MAGRVNQMMPSWPAGSSRPDWSVIATEPGATRPTEPRRYSHSVPVITVTAWASVPA